MGKRQRHAKGIKTGAEKLSQKINQRNESEDESDYESKRDKFNLSREETQEGLIRLDNRTPSDDDKYLESNVESVFDINVDDERYEEDDYDEMDDEEEEEDLSEEEEEIDDVSTDSETDHLKESLKPMNRTSLLNWGKRKSQYYEGDTADLEIGQEEEDALVEEEAGKEILRVRYEAMEDEDFLPAAVKTTTKDGNDDKETEIIVKKDKKQDFKKDHPEYLPILRHFQSSILPLEDLTDLLNHLQSQDGDQIGLTPSGRTFLQLKHILLQTCALNLCSYLLLKQEDKANTIKDHPVMQRLDTLDQLVYVLEKEIELPAGLKMQYDHLIKAIRYLEGNHSSSEDDDDEQEENSFDEESSNQERQIIPSEINSSSDEDSSSDDDENEAKFSIRSSDFNTSSSKSSNPLDFGDSLVSKSTTQQFSKMLNTVAQKTRQVDTKKKSKKDKLPVSQNAVVYDNNEEVDEDFMQGLKMMEQDLAQKGSDSDSEYYNQIKKQTQQKKQTKQQKYKPQPKFPKAQTLVMEGERAASRAILKNRGLVAHKNKLNRNPRVKKREQYRKALIRRRGAVRDVIEEKGMYGGEKSGINRLVSRSRQLGDK